MENEGAWVERNCLLFEAGEYADKGVTITESDLRAIARNTASEIPVRIEHLAESPFDAALGVVTKLRAEGGQLWGTLRQPVEAWQLAQKARAGALSVGLDVANRKLVETSFVCRPRVASARVFGGGTVIFTVELNLEEESGMSETGGGVKQFAEGLIAYLRGVAGGVGSESGASQSAGCPSPANSIVNGGESGALDFAAERAQWEQERQILRTERADRQILEWKREGRIRATERAETLARTLLVGGTGSVVAFDGASVPVATLFGQFVAENGPVVPMGERMASSEFQLSGANGGAGEKLVAMARERARQDSIGYVQAFAQVTAQHPELAQAAREE